MRLLTSFNALLFLLISSSIFAQVITPHIVLDQFGYLPNDQKIAYIRVPQVGWDAQQTFTPENMYSVINEVTNERVHRGNPIKWNNGATDNASGDKVWRFDFSIVTQDGNYYVKDELNGFRSNSFVITKDVYNDILKTAFKTLFYQRAGFAKKVPYAAVGYEDEASHIKALQDKNARLFNQKGNAATEKDLSGGWYDAGDYNKYTPWTANYILALCAAYEENPGVWSDDFGIPESGNGNPDLIDEVLFGLDWLLKMNQNDGSSLSILSVAHASPPSSATGQSLYGPATTNATFRSAAAFAYGATIVRNHLPLHYSSYADTLEARAIRAYDWATANPSVIFNNNSSTNGSEGIGAGNQETDSLGRFTAKMLASFYIFNMNKESKYIKVLENNYREFPLFKWNNYVSQYFLEGHQLLLKYSLLPEANPTIVQNIKFVTQQAIDKSGDFWAQVKGNGDPYNAFIKDYNWGSNQYKADYGNFFYNLATTIISDTVMKKELYKAAANYIHYIHGANPMNLVYLSNMGQYGAENSVNEFYHSWFADKSPKWDRVGVSTYGPVPGFLVGGPNQFYQKDGCCPNNCGSAANNAICNSESLEPPLAQPPMKSYKDFNTSWPLNSWQITENSNGYQIAYLRLLSKMAEDGPSSTNENVPTSAPYLYPNPSYGSLYLSDITDEYAQVTIYNHQGLKIMEKTLRAHEAFYTSSMICGLYYAIIKTKSKRYTQKLIIIE